MLNQGRAVLVYGFFLQSLVVLPVTLKHLAAVIAEYC